MGFSTVVEQAILTQYLKTGTAYAELYTAAPTDAGGGTVVSESGYVATGRLAVTFGSFSVAPGGGSRLANTNQLDFGINVGSSYTVGWVALFTAVTGGTFIGWVAVTATPIANSSRFQMAIGGLTFDLD